MRRIYLDKKYKYLISETTKEEREKYVKNALAISQIDAGPPDEETLKLFQLYIDGKMEIEDVQKIVIDNAKKIR